MREIRYSENTGNTGDSTTHNGMRTINGRTIPARPQNIVQLNQPQGVQPVNLGLYNPLHPSNYMPIINHENNRSRSFRRRNQSRNGASNIESYRNQNDGIFATRYINNQSIAITNIQQEQFYAQQTRSLQINITLRVQNRNHQNMADMNTNNNGLRIEISSENIFNDEMMPNHLNSQRLPVASLGNITGHISIIDTNQGLASEVFQHDLDNYFNSLSSADYAHLWEILEMIRRL
ncbi:hypothetical protein RF11_04343 [Thelohanellus kitauei]|uniref:Uncharacterized protein n=1 Tax=Thelohanellus kitauei TaxID=669202 RepID=A0A0C2NM55_THEKT|nr:hypothetical protein RF11_04343 [Thelohanellus kitauei]